MQYKSSITVYTDGACSGNPGKGGYGIVMLLDGSKYAKEFSQGFRKTTNNRMELLAVIVSLENLKKEGQKIRIYTDSKYVHDAIEKKWVFGWAKKGFKDKKNVDLWKRFLKIHPKHKLKMVWVKGHAGNSGNERADRLATSAYKKEELLIDEGFEKSLA